MQQDISSQDWARLLREAARTLAVGEVARPVRTRGAVPAPGQPLTLVQVLEQFLTQPTAVRIEVIGQVLEDVDDLAMRVLRVLAVDCRDPDPNVRWSITEGLGSLQRLDAIELLELIAQGDPDETVRSGAIGALARRAMAAYREKAGPEVATPRTLVRTRGPVRTRGASPVRAASPEAATILEKLHRLRDEESSDYIRNVLDTTLVQLGE